MKICFNFKIIKIFFKLVAEIRHNKIPLQQRVQYIIGVYLLNSIQFGMNGISCVSNRN